MAKVDTLLEEQGAADLSLLDTRIKELETSRQELSKAQEDVDIEVQRKYGEWVHREFGEQHMADPPKITSCFRRPYTHKSLPRYSTAPLVVQLANHSVHSPQLHRVEGIACRVAQKPRGGKREERRDSAEGPGARAGGARRDARSDAA